MAVNRYYSSTAQETTLSSGISNADTAAAVGGTTGFPVSYPYTLIIDRGTASEEVVEVTNAVSTTLTIIRGVDSTSAVSHSAGAAVVHGISARDHREAQQHIAAASGVHGVSGSVVGTTDSQTLTNKTLTAPTINNGTWASATLSGTPTIGDFTNAQHDHSAANKGGAVPQASVTGLVSALSTITTTNNTQDTNISSLGTRMTTAESNITTNATNITTANTNISSNTSAIATLQTPPYAILRRSSNQSVPDSTTTAVVWNAEDADSANGHSNSSNASRYVVPVTGVYLVATSVPFEPGTGIREVNFRVNGSTSYAGQRLVYSSNITSVLTSTHLLSLSSGDYVEVIVWQNTGSSLNIDQTYAAGPHMEIIQLR